MKSLVVLVGMMGVGKTSAGLVLSKVLKYKFVDVDKEIEKQQNKSVSAIFNEFGESYFRNLEKEFINKVTEVKESTTVYARWVQDQGDIMSENILNCVSDDKYFIVKGLLVNDLVKESGLVKALTLLFAANSTILVSLFKKSPLNK